MYLLTQATMQKQNKVITKMVGTKKQGTEW